MSSPQHNFACSVVVTREESTRIRAFILRVGFGVAAKCLRVGADTLEAARDRGTMRAATHARIFEALAREEAALS